MASFKQTLPRHQQRNRPLMFFLLLEMTPNQWISEFSENKPAVRHSLCLDSRPAPLCLLELMFYEGGVEGVCCGSIYYTVCVWACMCVHVWEPVYACEHIWCVNRRARCLPFYKLACRKIEKKVLCVKATLWWWALPPNEPRIQRVHHNQMTRMCMWVSMWGCVWIRLCVCVCGTERGAERRVRYGVIKMRTSWPQRLFTGFLESAGKTPWIRRTL